MIHTSTRPRFALLLVALALGAALFLTLASPALAAGNGHAYGKGGVNGAGDTGDTGTAICLGDEAGASIHESGSGSGSHSFSYCSDPTFNLTVLLVWDNGKKDLGLKVTEPDGTVHIVDHHNTRSEAYFQAATLPEGDWQVEVFNNGNGAVDYRLTIVAG